MSRYHIILYLSLSFSGLNVWNGYCQEINNRRISGKDSAFVTSDSIAVEKVRLKDSVKQHVPDSVRFSSKTPPAFTGINKVNIVSVKPGLRRPGRGKAPDNDSLKLFIQTFEPEEIQEVKHKIIYPPDSVRFAPGVPPAKAGEMHVNIVSLLPGLAGKSAKGSERKDSSEVFIKVLRKEDATAWLTTVAPEVSPSRSFSLVNMEENLVVPEWFLVRQRAVAEEERRTAKLKADSAKAPKPRVLKQWKLSGDFTDEIPVVFDTLFSLFNRYRIADLHTPVNSMLGSYGLPYYSISYFDRITDPDRFLYANHYGFMHMDDNAMFMNLQLPFTELKWVLSGERDLAEQTFRIKHSQNINRKLNFGVIYDIIYNLGMYSAQRAEDKTFSFYTSYTGSVYKLYIAAGINGLFSQENGGITSKEELDIDITNTRDIPVNLGTLNNASNQMKNRNLLVVQRFSFIGAQPDRDTIPLLNTEPVPFKGTFSHILQYDFARRSYTDESPGSGFYDSIYMNSSVTFDSLSARFVKNTIRLDFQTDETKWISFGAGLGLRNENFWYAQIVPQKDTVGADTANWFRGNNVLTGRVTSKIGDNFRWGVNGEWFFDRYREGDYILNGMISRSFDLKKGKLEWQFTGKTNSRTPSFWYNQWGGNHYQWENNFKKQSLSEAGTRVLYPGRKLDFRFNYALINNYLDFDTLAMPSQDTTSLSVMAISLRKDFRLWKFHLEPDIIIQKSSNEEILSLPQATVRTAIYIEHLFD